jgi:ABC-type antimicrobial peptide transport system permease subunit
MLKSYLSLILRIIVRNKIFSGINILGLSIGLTISYLIFLWVQDELSFDSFHQYADDICRVTVETPRPEGVFRAAVTPAPTGDYLENEIPEILDHVLLRPLSGKYLVEYAPEVDASSERKYYEEGIVCVDSSFFDLFSYKFLAGDPATAPRGNNFIILTKSISDKFFADENPIGKTLTLDNNSWTGMVTGVIEDHPSNTHLTFDILLPIEIFSEFGTNMGWGHFYFNNYVRLQAGTDPGSLTMKINETLEKVRTNSQIETIFSLQALQDIHLRSEFDIDYNDSSTEISQEVYVFSVIAIFILLIACLNFMMLSTARATSRALETGVRKVSGASKSKLIIQFLGESLFFAFVSFFIALIFMSLLLPFFNAFTEKDLSLNLADNLGTWGIFLMITLLTGILAGLYPAFLLSSFNPLNIFKGRYSTGSGGSGIRKVLVVLQFSISIGLIIGTIVVHEQLTFIRNLDLGYNKDHLIYLPTRGDFNDLDVFAKELRNYAGISNLTFSSDIPTNTIHLWGGNSWEGKEDDEQILAHFYTVDFDFVPTMKIDMAEGKNFNMSSDSGNYILNEAAVKVFGITDPVGKWYEYSSIRGEIIGVIKDFNYKSVHTKVEPMVLRVGQYYRYIIIRLAGNNMSAAITHIKNQWEQYIPDYPFEFHFLDQELARNYGREQNMGVLFNYFALLAIFISCLGLFGLSAFMAQQRIKEIGIRKVMGASTGKVLALLTKNFSLLVLLANIIAWPVAWWALKNWLENFSYHTDISLWIFPVAGLLALAIALTTTAWQAYSAAITNPAETLKYE